MLGRFGLSSLVFLGSIGLCQKVLWSYLSAGRADLESIGTIQSGGLFPTVCCGVFGENIMGDVLRIVNGLLLRSS